ncbi:MULTISPECIES: PIN domain-containing protein [unclassified Haematobacter]|jgi:predicted nucleic acid-binding protein|uniref:PIN domain-containing protein n=1 Tax=unclassified Haematobacter TaxID=2640585 RepID=UPI0025C57326|nr:MULTISPECIES: PIN domain-containing protein [unclassified Haematobacter]
MAFKSAVAIYDACILYPFHLRNVVVQAAVDGLVDAHWTEAIHDEWIRNLLANTPGLPPEHLQATKQLMKVAVPEATVTGYERHIHTVSLPDPDDRHVAAAAIEAGASMIVTWNLRDFPVAELRKHGLARQSPDAFLVGLYEQAPDMLLASLANARSNLSRTRVSAADFVGILRDQRLVKLAAQIENHVSDL